MDEFRINAENGLIYLKLDQVFGFPNKTFHAGGYDTKSFIEINASNYSVKSYFYVSTGDVYTFFIQFKKCFEDLTGEAVFESYEKNLKFKMVFNRTGKVEIVGNYIEYYHSTNELKFELETDQSYLSQTLIELTHIFNKYGGLIGVAN